MITIFSKEQGFGIKFPTSVKEVCEPKNLELLTHDINLSPYYCVVMMAMQTRLSAFCISLGGKTRDERNKDSQMLVTCVMAKIKDEDAKSINCEVGNILCVDRSTIERGIHVGVPTMLTSGAVSNFFTNDDSLRTQCAGLNIGNNTKDSPIIDDVTGMPVDPKEVGNIIMLGFKIIPVNAIAGNIAKVEYMADPYKVLPGSVC